LAEDEAVAVEIITTALKGNPLRVLQEVAIARLNDCSFTSVAQGLQLDASPEKLTAQTTATLSNVQRRMLSALVIFSGASVRAATLGELLQVEDAETILEGLEERHLVRASQGRYTLAGEVAAFTLKETETSEMRKRAVAYFADWSERHQREVKAMLETLPVLMCCLRWGVKLGLATDVIRITKALELTLVLNARWESWANALRLAAQSAVAASDKAALGWVRHQNGTKALCDENLSEARESLEQALQIREALSDTVGAQVTRHNLNLVAPPIILPWKLWKSFAGIGVGVCALIVAVAFASKFHLLPPLPTTAPTITPTATPTLPSPTAAPTGTPTATPTSPSPAPAPTLAATSTVTPPSSIPTTPPIMPTISPNPLPPVRIVTFTGTPKVIARGERATLSYRLENAEHASIDPSVGRIDPTKDNVSVSPATGTIYTLTAFGRDGGTQQEQVTIEVNEPPAKVTIRAVTFDSGAVTAGRSVRGTVVLNGPATAGDAHVRLTSRPPGFASTDGEIVISQGQREASFPVRTTGKILEPQRVIITGSFNGTASGAFMIQPPAEEISLRLTLNPTSVMAGDRSRATVTIRGMAERHGAQVAVSTSDSRLATTSKRSVVAYFDRPGTFDIITLPRIRSSSMVRERLGRQEVRIFASSGGRQSVETLTILPRPSHEGRDHGPRRPPIHPWATPTPPPFSPR